MQSVFGQRLTSMDTKKLRQKILDLAIHGKLVPQDPNDEPASVLFERIKAEKERLIKEGKIKRTKKSAKTSDTPHYQQGVPFEVPKGWVWTTVNNISKSILYGVSESAKSEGKYKLLRITDIQDNQVNWDTVPFTDFDEEKVSSYILRDGDIVFARTGATVGKSYLINGLSQKAIYASYLIRVQTYDLILPEYIKLFFESGYYWQQIQLNSVGIGQPNVNGTILGNLNLPLPPYVEQKRIVAEIERWLSFIDIIEGEKRDLQTIIKQAKSKILDLAIHGKLVPQDPNDEPASELLKRINPKAEITCDNGHTEKLPKGWITTQLDDLAEIKNGYAFKSSKYVSSNGVRIIRIANVQDGYIEDKMPQFYPFEEMKTLEDFMLIEGDMLMSLTGNVGRVGILKEKFLPAALNQRVAHIIEKSNIIEKKYLFYLFQTNDFLKDCLNSGKGVAQLNISTEWLKHYIILLPPLAEQRRIVAKIEELFSVLDNIQNALEA